MRKLLKISVVAVLIATLISVPASAGLKMRGYRLVLDRLNGYKTTKRQTKKYTGVTGLLRSNDVGGKYKVDARMQNKQSKAGWVRGITDYDVREIYITPKLKAGDKVRLNFSNGFLVIRTVLVVGDWRSN